MKYLVTGLGNPGAEYENTRHNIGFKVLDALAAEYGGTWETAKFGWIARISIKGRKLLLLKPNTYMNLSGKAVFYWLHFEKIEMEKLLVITDDLALPSGKLRLKMKGNDGGHNGLKSINEVMQTQNYPRLRFGIGNDFAKGRQVEFVLGNWTEAELPTIEGSIKSAVEAVCTFVLEGSGRAMTKYNA